MKTFLKIVGGFAALVLLLVLAAFAFPRHYRIQREVRIEAKPEAVYPLVADLRAWKAWSAWHERDPAMKLSYSENTTGIGAWSAWESAKEGNGRMTITEVAATRVGYSLEFPDFGTRSLGTVEFAPEGAGTRVTWRDEGDLGMNPLNRWFGLFVDRLIGPDFERGLANLERLAEK